MSNEQKDGPWCHCGELMSEHKPWGSCTNPREMRNPRCEHEGCDQEGFECIFACDDDGPTHFYCPHHAAEQGYCYLCGIFSAGIESFDFLHPGLCDNCHAELIESDDTDCYDY